jgi:hypothetical protein
MSEYSGFTARRDRPGFWITFANGWHVSVQFGKWNYCANRTDWDVPDGDPPWSSPDAEIALFDPTGNMQYLAGESDTVRGYVKPDELISFMSLAAHNPKLLVSHPEEPAI